MVRGSCCQDSDGNTLPPEPRVWVQHMRLSPCHIVQRVRSNTCADAVNFLGSTRVASCRASVLLPQEASLPPSQPGERC